MLLIGYTGFVVTTSGHAGRGYIPMNPFNGFTCEEVVVMVNASETRNIWLQIQRGYRNACD